MVLIHWLRLIQDAAIGCLIECHLFEREVLIVIEKEEGMAYDIFKLLDELAFHELPSSAAKYLIEFEGFIHPTWSRILLFAGMMIFILKRRSTR